MQIQLPKLSGLVVAGYFGSDLDWLGSGGFGDGFIRSYFFIKKEVVQLYCWISWFVYQDLSRGSIRIG